MFVTLPTDVSDVWGGSLLEFFSIAEKGVKHFFVCSFGHFIMVITAWHAYLILYFLPKNMVVAWVKKWLFICMQVNIQPCAQNWDSLG